MSADLDLFRAQLSALTKAASGASGWLKAAGHGNENAALVERLKARGARARFEIARTRA